MLSQRAAQKLSHLVQCRGYASRPPPNRYAKAAPVVMIVIGATATLAGSLMMRNTTIHTDSEGPSALAGNIISEASPGLTAPPQMHSKNELRTFFWGTNRYITTASASPDPIRSPQPVTQISGPGVALRDLQIHQKHAACVDAAGNLYQWGEGFHGSNPSNLDPIATLKGKDIVSISLSSEKVYALSRSGQVHVVSAQRERQALKESSTKPSSSWWGLGWLSPWHSKLTIDFAELKPDAKLSRGERFISISSGRSHLLALTSAGRTFVSPISLAANSHGQLGTRKVHLSSASGGSDQVPIELIPKSQSDPYAQTTPVVRTSSSTSAPTSPPRDILDEADIHFCDTLFEVPALKGVPVEQAVAGDRSSFVKTKNEGRVLGWGANEYGQIGLGTVFPLAIVPIPTEVVLSRNYPGGTSTKCLNIAAGGDIAYFTVQYTSPNSNTAIDLLACGMGQFGSLGNGLFSQSQGSPVRVKSISGVQEYNDRTKSLQPLAPKTVSASPTHHTIVALDTFDAHGSGIPTGRGRDMMVWGLNSDYQLGLKGKRSNMPQPTLLPSDAFVLAGEADADSQVGRMLLRERTVDVLRDLEGNKVKKNAQVEQTAVAGWGCSAIYWKVVS